MMILIQFLLSVLISFSVLGHCRTSRLDEPSPRRGGRVPSPPQVGDDGNETRNSAVKMTGKDFRILPLGDSITQGFGSSDGNGYRRDLQTLLLANSSLNTLDYVGSFTSGTMVDNREQGIDGAEISDIAAALAQALTFRPNVVLPHAGTNDMEDNVNVTTAPERLGWLIDGIFDGCPDAVVVVAQIIASLNATTDAMIVSYNEAVGKLALWKRMMGQHVVLVDMQMALPPSEYNDMLHPNDQGYMTMAMYWYRGIIEANDAGWIGRPVVANVTNGAGMS